MPRSESTTPGSEVTHSQERDSTGLLTQGGTGTRATPTFSADDDQTYGQVECWAVKCVTVADTAQAYDAAAAITNVFGSTKVARTNSYRILRVETSLRSLLGGSSTDNDLKVQAGNGAASESFADLVASVDIDSDTVNLPISRILVKAETILLTGETLRVQYSAVGDSGTGEVDVYIYAIPVKV